MSFSHTHICGCYYTDHGPNSHRSRQRNYLPQVQLESHTTITPLYFTTKLSQTFTNPTGNQLPQTRYTFPLYDGVAVSAFTCTIGDKVVKGHVEQKEQARKTFDAAVQKGQSAGLLESLPFGVFGVTLGNISANASIHVDIVYGGELKHDAQIDGLRYMLPTSIAPRYGSYPGNIVSSDAVAHKGIKIIIDFDMRDSAIRMIQCPSNHPIALSIGALSTEADMSFNMSKASVTLTHGTTELGSDFILQILIDDISAPKAILEKHTALHRHALMATFVPKFNLQPIRPEIIFIADQSGSMQGPRNTALVAALKTFLKSLPIGVRFNICAFGSFHNFMWEKSVLYTDETLTQALAFIQGFNASYGGTELLKPVVAAFDSHFTDLPLELIVLTDGQISAESQLFKYVTDKIHNEKVDARCFVLGVGGGVSHSLVEGFARAGNGICQFVSDGEVMDLEVVRMLKAALYPHIKDYSLEVLYEAADDDYEMVENESPEKIVDDGQCKADDNTAAGSVNQPKAPISLFDKSADMSISPAETSDRYAHLPDIAIPRIIQAPHAIPTLLPFSRFTVHLLLRGLNKQVPRAIVLHGSCPDGPLRLGIPVKRIDNPDNTINTLAAKRAIQELEENRGWLTDAREGDELIKVKYPSRYEELVERELVRLGVEYQVANRVCSFVAVQKDGASSSSDNTSADEDMGFGLFDDGPVQTQPKRKRVATLGYAAARSLPVASGFGSPGQLASSRATTRPVFGGPSFSASGFSAPRAAHSGMTMSAHRAQALSMGLSSEADPEPDGIPPQDTGNAVRALIDLQKFEGNWRWSQQIINFINKDVVDEVKKARADEDSLLATVLVLAWLKVKASEYRDLWDMVADKSVQWLAVQDGSDGLLEKAEQAFALV